LLDQAATTFETQRHKQLAQIKAAYILANDGAYSDVINRIGPLMEKDAPYEFLARELPFRVFRPRLKNAPSKTYP